MSTTDFQKRLERIQVHETPEIPSTDGSAATRSASKGRSTRGPSLNVILGGCIAACLAVSIGIVAIFGMDSFRSGGEETAEAPKPTIRRMN